MEFKGRIMKVLEPRSGVSQKTGNEWKMYAFIFEYFENPTDRYSDKVVLETMDDKIGQALKEGLEVNVGFGHSVREFEGKYYNSVKLYKIESIRNDAAPAQPTADTTQAPAATTSSPATPKTDAEDDLPF